MNKNVDPQKRYDSLMKQAAKQPGITELMKVYGQYDQLVKQSNEYLANTRPRSIISTTNSSC